MFTIAIVALCVVALLAFYRKPKPPTAGGQPQVLDFLQAAAPMQSPDRRMELVSKKLQEVADERLMNETLDDLGVARAKAARPVPTSS